MKIAITARNPNLESEMDPRFGRAAFIVIVDTESMEYKAIDNSANAGAFKGAGIQAATMIHDHGADVLLTGYCGPKAFQTLNAAGIKVIDNLSGSISEAIDQFKSGNLSYAAAANTEAHW